MTVTTEEKTKEEATPTEAELRELGLTEAANKVKTARELARKLRIAFEHFRVVTPEVLTRFKKDLHERTYKQDIRTYTESFHQLKLTALESYTEVPPAEVLKAIRGAKELKCFDRFEVATIEAVQRVPDPVVFGIIDGCDNKYFVAQWDNDLKIEDILREDEG